MLHFFGIPTAVKPSDASMNFYFFIICIGFILVLKKRKTGGRNG
jgi:hypothetical protein